MSGSFFSRGLLEIYRFLPPPLLEKFDPETVSFDDFLDYLAQARVAQKLEEDIVARAVNKVFSDD